MSKEFYYEWNRCAGQGRGVHLLRIVPPATAYPACHCNANDYMYRAAPELAHLGCESGKAVLRGEIPHWIHFTELQQMAREALAELNATQSLSE